MDQSGAARWILAFDGSCGGCRTISLAVAEACDGKLEVLPLRHVDVERWRETALGPDPVWTPTLIRVEGDAARAWTGPRLAVRLVRVLGPRYTVKVLRALGRLRLAATSATSQESVDGLSRKAFLQLGLGTVVAGGIVLSGSAPAFADPAQGYVRANQGNLPRTYAEMIRLPVSYRRAVFQELSPGERSALWTAHVDQFVVNHPELSSQQLEVVQRVRVVVGDQSLYTAGATISPEVGILADQVRDVLGTERATALVAVLGPSDAAEAAGLSPEAIGCKCSVTSDFCNNGTNCSYRYRSCIVQRNQGCGFAWAYTCDGQCVF